MPKRCQFYKFDGYFCHFIGEDGKKYSGEKSFFELRRGSAKKPLTRYEIRDLSGNQILSTGDSFSIALSKLGYLLENGEDPEFYLQEKEANESK